MRLPIPSTPLVGLLMVCACSSDGPTGPGAPDHLVLTPSSLTLRSVGEKGTISATLEDAQGHAVQGAPAAWASRDTAVVSVDATGEVTARTPGLAWIVATSGALVDSVPVTVDLSGQWAGVPAWSSYQGDGRHRAHVPVTLNPDSFRESWRTVVQAGTHLGRTAVAQGDVFVVPYARVSQTLMSYDVLTGSLNWRNDVGSFYALHDPGYAGGKLFVTSSGHAFMRAFDAESGELLYRAAFPDQWSRYLAPVVWNDVVIAPGLYYGGFIAYDVHTGAKLWEHAGGYDNWTPALDGDVLYVFDAWSPVLAAYRPLDGESLFRIPGPAWTDSPIMFTPTIGHRNNVVATHDGALMSFDLGGRRLEWSIRDGYRGAVAAAEGTLVVNNGTAVEGVDEATGEILWRWNPDPDDWSEKTFLATDNLVFVSNRGRTRALDLDTGGELWSFDEWGTLAMAPEGLLLIADGSAKGQLIAIDVRTRFR